MLAIFLLQYEQFFSSLSSSFYFASRFVMRSRLNFMYAMRMPYM